MRPCDQGLYFEIWEGMKGLVVLAFDEPAFARADSNAEGKGVTTEKRCITEG